MYIYIYNLNNQKAIKVHFQVIHNYAETIQVE